MIDVKHGFAFKGQFFTDKQTTHILLTPGNFSIGGGFKDEKFTFYEGPVNDRFVLSEGDLIVSMTDLSKMGDTLGFPAMIPSSESFRYLHNQRLGKIIFTDSNRLDKFFLYYLLCSNDYRQEVLASATGTTVRHTSPDRIKSYKFLLPPIKEQQKIGIILSLLDKKIFCLLEQKTVLKKIIESIFKSRFIDFEGQTEFVDSELGEIPRSWEIKRIDEVCETFGGGTPSTKNKEFWDGKINWAVPSDLTKNNLTYLKGTERKITEIGLKNCASKLHPSDSILMTSRATIGFFSINKVLQLLIKVLL